MWFARLDDSNMSSAGIKARGPWDLLGKKWEPAQDVCWSRDDQLIVRGAEDDVDANQRALWLMKPPSPQGLDQGEIGGSGEPSSNNKFMTHKV